MASSFSDVATAFGVDFGAIDRSALASRQLSQQQIENDRNRRERKDADTANYLDGLDKQFAPSMTIHDSYDIPLAKSIKEKVYQASKANPNWSKTQLKQHIAPDVAQWHFGRDMAQAYDKQILDEATRLAKEDPYFNDQQYIQDKRKAVFIDPSTGQIAPIPSANPFADPKFDVNDPNVRDNYTRQDLLDAQLQTMHKKALEPQEGTMYGVENANGLQRKGVWKYKGNQMQTPKYDEQGNVVGVAFSPNTISIGDKNFEVLPEEIINPLSGTKEYKTMERFEKKRLFEANPELTEQPDAIVNKIVGANIAKRYVGAETSKASFDPEQQNYIDKRKQEAFSNQMRRNSDARANRQLQMSELKFKASQSDQKNAPTSYFNTIVDIANGENPKGEKGAMMSPMHIKPSAKLQDFIAEDIMSQDPDVAAAYKDAKTDAEKQGFVKIYDIAAFAKGKYITDNQGKPVKAYMWVTPSGKRGIVEAEYGKNDKGEMVLSDKALGKKNGVEVAVDRNPYRKPKASVNQLLQLYRPSFQNESKNEKEIAIEKLTNTDDAE